MAKTNAQTLSGNGTVKIEKGIPIKKPMGGCSVYPYLEMEVGDSFLIPGDVKAVTAYGVGREGRNKAVSNGKNWSFAVRKTPDGFRCWRIS